MAKQTINIGTSPNDGTGDPLRTAGQKINANFTEVYGIAQGAYNTANDHISKIANSSYELVVDEFGVIRVPLGFDNTTDIFAPGTTDIRLGTENDHWTFIGDGSGLRFPDGTTQTTAVFDNENALNLKGSGVIRSNTSVNVVGTSYSQLQWVDSGNVSISDPNNTQGPTNWVYVQEDGFIIETNINYSAGNTAHTWVFNRDGVTVLPVTNYAPSTARGNPGDVAGMFAIEGAYIFYCYANYTDGSTPIWQKVAMDNTDWD